MRRLALLIVLAVAAPVAAQPGNTPPNAQKRRERIKNRIRALRAARLVEELGEAATGKILPVLAKYDDDFDKLLQQRAEIEKKLAAAPDSAVDKVIDEAVANQRAFWDAEDSRLKDIRKLLPPPQVARLLVVLPPLERKIQNQLRNAIQKMQQQQRQPRPNDPDLDDLDDDTPAPPPPAQGPARRQQPCDPYSSPHGCK
jgi:hypothetical protein